VIAKRAKVSDGALFRHFATMGDFTARRIPAESLIRCALR
jgi:AcrR family transcriptional regulator